MALAKVLIIEDDEVYGKLLQIRFAKYPAYALTIAQTLQEGIDLLKKAAVPYDVVCVDLKLPDAPGGLDTVKRVMAETATPVLIMTGSPIDDISQEASRMGVAGILQKNALGIDSMLNAISSAMSQTKFYQENTQQLRVADQVHHLSLRNTAYVLSISAAFSVNFLAIAAFLVDAYAQITFEHSYHIPVWIGAAIVPALVSAAAWLYSKKQQEYLQETANEE